MQVGEDSNLYAMWHGQDELQDYPERALDFVQALLDAYTLRMSQKALNLGSKRIESLLNGLPLSGLQLDIVSTAVTGEPAVLFSTPLIRVHREWAQLEEAAEDAGQCPRLLLTVRALSSAPPEARLQVSFFPRLTALALAMPTGTAHTRALCLMLRTAGSANQSPWADTPAAVTS